MKSILPTVFVVMALLNCEMSCLQQYHEFEEKFWSVEENLDKLQDMFYPTNTVRPNFIYVDYSCINESNETVITCTLAKNNPLGYIYFPDKINQYCDEDHNVSQLCNWIWTDTAIYLVYSPAVFNALAHFTESFFAIRYYHTVQLHLPVLCDKIPKDYVKKLTTRLKSLATAKDTRIIKPHKNRGYAVQAIGDQNNIAKSVLGGMFHYFIRMPVYLINLMATLYAVPYLLNVAVWAYPTVYSGITVSPLWYAVTWATLIVCTLLNVAILVLHIWMVIFPICDFGFGVNIAYFIGMFLIELATVFLIPMKNNIKIPGFISCYCGNNGKLNLLIQKLAVWSVFIFVQLLIERIVFIVMAFVYHPFTTAGMFIAYTLCIICITLLIAIIILLEELIFCAVNRNFYGVADILLCIMQLAKTIYGLMIFLCALVVLVGNAFVEKQRHDNIHNKLASSSLDTSIFIALIGYIAALYIKSIVWK